jgi:hypothetical protein
MTDADKKPYQKQNLVEIKKFEEEMKVWKAVSIFFHLQFHEKEYRFE